MYDSDCQLLSPCISHSLKRITQFHVTNHCLSTARTSTSHIMLFWCSDITACRCTSGIFDSLVLALLRQSYWILHYTRLMVRSVRLCLKKERHEAEKECDACIPDERDSCSSASAIVNTWRHKWCHLSQCIYGWWPHLSGSKDVQQCWTQTRSSEILAAVQNWCLGIQSKSCNSGDNAFNPNLMPLPGLV